ncbi:hypothetical protein V6N13_042194 [Hibiscus sabdariffa]|uniref:Secreted protein n=1 Tax=Hibiscus sabdariffa TaxID=183260 RepID=A0ABR2DEA5_9ROSI
MLLSRFCLFHQARNSGERNCKALFVSFAMPFFTCARDHHAAAANNNNRRATTSSVFPADINTPSKVAGNRHRFLIDV